MQRILGVSLIAWFLAITALVLVPSYRLLSASPRTNVSPLPSPPTPPAAPELVASEQKDLRDNRVTVFSQQVTVYGQLISAYSQYLAAVENCSGTVAAASLSSSPQASVLASSVKMPGEVLPGLPVAPGGSRQPCPTNASNYELVVTKTLQPLLDRFLVAVLAFVFAKVSAQVVDNAIRIRNGHPPQQISLWS